MQDLKLGIDIVRELVFGWVNATHVNRPDKSSAAAAYVVSDLIQLRIACYLFVPAFNLNTTKSEDF